MGETERTPWETLNPALDAQADLEPSFETRHPTPETRSVSRAGLFTIPLIAIGVCLIACCMIIPAADENRRLAYERQRLAADLEQLEKQVATNDEFLKRINDDPTLLERLARRQLKMVRQGTTVMELKAQPTSHDMSPFLLVTVPPPAPFPDYQPIGGVLSTACRHPKTQLYLIGGALLMIACGLVLGRSNEPELAVSADS